MSKGKKYSAAEKHFLKKEEAYRKEQKRLYDNLDAAYSTINQLRKEIIDLNAQISELTVERDEILKLSAMSPDELKKHIVRTKKAAEMCDMFFAVKNIQR